jgi:predicted Zn-dependent protease
MRSFRRFLPAVATIGFALLLYGCSDTSTPTGPEDPPNGSDDDDTPVQFNSEAAPGDSARSFLDDRRFTVLSLEVDYMEGYEPTSDALDSLKTALNAHLSKSSLHIPTPTQIPAAGQGPYSTDQVRGLEEEHRNHYTRAESDTLWAYFLVVDGKYSSENVVGIAYYNTSMAFFGKTIEEITGGVTKPSREKVEATVFRHEFGHNLGLVNNGIPMQQDHQDDDNGPHCTNEQCVMYYAIETTDYFANVFDGTIPTFEQFCTADMAAQDGQ